MDTASVLDQQIQMRVYRYLFLCECVRPVCVRLVVGRSVLVCVYLFIVKRRAMLADAALSHSVCLWPSPTRASRFTKGIANGTSVSPEWICSVRAGLSLLGHQ